MLTQKAFRTPHQHQKLNDNQQTKISSNATRIFNNGRHAHNLPNNNSFYAKFHNSFQLKSFAAFSLIKTIRSIIRNKAAASEQSPIPDSQESSKGERNIPTRISRQSHNAHDPHSQVAIKRIHDQLNRLRGCLHSKI